MSPRLPKDFDVLTLPGNRRYESLNPSLRRQHAVHDEPYLFILTVFRHFGHQTLMPTVTIRVDALVDDSRSIACFEANKVNDRDANAIARFLLKSAREISDDILWDVLDGSFKHRTYLLKQEEVDDVLAVASKFLEISLE